MTYQAVVCKINTFPHPNADRLQLGMALGNQVVVGLDVEDGDLGVYFNTDGQLSQEMCDANDLIAYTDENGVRHGGYFPKNRRVRSQLFRSERSDGYWTPLSSLAFTGDIYGLQEGDSFDTINGIPICNKYVTKATRAAGNAARTMRRANSMFERHVETKQFRFHASLIPEGSVLYFTEKQHGTSARLGLVLEEKMVKPKGLFGFLRKKRAVKQYSLLVGTRNTILSDYSDQGWGSQEFRWQSIKDFAHKLHKGEIIYGEIVGYSDTGTIMPPVPLKEMRKATQKKYKNTCPDGTMTYSYGEAPWNCRFYAYRITRLNEDGVVTELSWPQVQRRCLELNIESVREIHRPMIMNGLDELLGIVEGLTEGPSTFSNSHIREGVVVRIENESGVTFLKNKSFDFGLGEGYLKNDEEYVDMEESS